VSDYTYRLLVAFDTLSVDYNCCKFICWFWYIVLTFVPNWFNWSWCTLVNQVDQFDQTVLSNRTVDRWWGCHACYCILYIASSILHIYISTICLTLIVCCMCCSPCGCSLCGTHSDNRHIGFLHDHLELLYHRQNGYSRLACGPGFGWQSAEFNVTSVHKYTK
jgi:hypothetical protein